MVLLNWWKLAVMASLTSDQVQDLDSYAFLAVLGKRVIHPGGRASTDRPSPRTGGRSTGRSCAGRRVRSRHDSHPAGP
jgi:hypothetical protein